MIIKDYYSTRSDKLRLFRFFSSEGFKIRKAYTDEIYDEAIDVETSNFEYIETDEKIENYKEETKEETNENQGEE